MNWDKKRKFVTIIWLTNFTNIENQKYL